TNTSASANAGATSRTPSRSVRQRSRPSAPTSTTAACPKVTATSCPPTAGIPTSAGAGGAHRHAGTGATTAGGERLTPHATSTSASTTHVERRAEVLIGPPHPRGRDPPA